MLRKIAELISGISWSLAIFCRKYLTTSGYDRSRFFQISSSAVSAEATSAVMQAEQRQTYDF